MPVLAPADCCASAGGGDVPVSEGIAAAMDGEQVTASASTITTVTGGGNVPDTVRTVTVSVTAGSVDVRMPASGRTIRITASNSRTWGNGDQATGLLLETGANRFQVAPVAGADEYDVHWEV